MDVKPISPRLTAANTAGCHQPLASLRKMPGKPRKYSGNHWVAERFKWPISSLAMRQGKKAKIAPASSAAPSESVKWRTQQYIAQPDSIKVSSIARLYPAIGPENWLKKAPGNTAARAV